MNIKCYAAAVMLLIASVVARAQEFPVGGSTPQGGRPDRPPQGDQMMENFFNPELIMRNQKALGLKDDQQAAIRKEMQQMMTRFTDLQWQQSTEEEAMAALVKQDHPDEKQVLAQLDKLLNIESEVKRLHMGMLVRIKNILTPEQQAKLRELRPRAQKQGPQKPASGRPPSADTPPSPDAKPF